MKESDYITAQVLTRLRIACDVIESISVYHVPASEKERFIEARKALFEVRNTAYCEIPIEEKP